MRFFVVFLVSLFLTAPIFLLTALAHGQEPEFPYEAIVLAEQAEIFSGPGSVHYTTDRLEQGRRVEVYRHDPGGWCAVRPPFGSFSLIPEGALTLVADDVATVLEDDTRAWVGTKTGAVDSPLWQIKLDRGEMVEVIGEVSWPDPAGHSTIWYQIAPPSGEFRWVRMSDLQLPEQSGLSSASEEAGRQDRFASTQSIEQQAIQQLANEQPASSPPPAAPSRSFDQQTPRSTGLQNVTSAPGFAFENVVQAGATSELAAPPYDTNVRQVAAQSPIQSTPEVQAPLAVTADAINDGWRRSTIPGRRNSEPVVMDNIPNTFTAPAFPTNAVSPVAETRPDQRIAQRDTRSVSARELPATVSIPEIAEQTLAEARDASLAELSTGPIGTALRELDIRLSREMVESPDLWRLETIKGEVQDALARASEAGDRAFGDRLLDKIRNCTYLRDQYRRQASADRASNVISSGVVQASATGVTGSGVEQAVMLDTTYDAHGWLNELVRENGQGTSTYVLQDETGRITHHIAAVPGLNLHRYLKQEIGVIGQRGYNRRLKLDHVTAQRIIELNTIRR
ncbi:MAG: hypothetical protein AAF456_13360 [Planctomycetota bacterium]